MRYTQRLLLLSLLVFGGMLLLSSTSQHAFAAHDNVKTHRILLPDPNNYVQGYMDGYRSGYGQGLESCTLQNIQTAADMISVTNPNPPTRYENGQTAGYSRGYAKGEEDCQAQIQSSQPPTQQPQATSPSPSWYYSY